MKEGKPKLGLFEIIKNKHINLQAIYSSGNLRQDWEDAYEMRDTLQLEPANLNEQRFAIRWV